MHEGHTQTGGSLFEVLISVLILALGVLGVAAVQTTALSNARHALESSQAEAQGQAILETLRSRRQDAFAGHYHTGGFVCNAQASSDIGRWLGHLKEALGETACVDIACQAGAIVCKVGIRWGAAVTGEPHELITGARL